MTDSAWGLDSAWAGDRDRAQVSPEHDPDNESFPFQSDFPPNPQQRGTVLAFLSGEECDLYSEHNVRFWMNSGTAPHDSRTFGNILKHLEELFPGTSRKTSIMKFLAHVVRIEYHTESIVRLSGFCDVVRWFGPFREIVYNQKKTCVCLCNLELLMTESQVLVSKQKMSWFAGHMSSAAAEEKLRGQPSGTYLVRFSESERKTGSFALSINVADGGGTEHVTIQGDPKMVNSEVAAKRDDPNLWLQYCADSDGRTYPSLPVLMNKRLMEDSFHDDHEDTACETACPDLPLNAIFRPYRNNS
ncbi:unnamed protein product [Lampetra fluviatilis]